ncbi:MAG TPA: PDZ domain-containing protein [Acidimicrobiales bacterium]|nr:PDZ domain-containing protein [Acidimicrobiales bacterium]
MRSPLGWNPVEPPPRHRLLGLTIALVLVFGIVAVGFNLPLPYYALAPGSARDVGPLIEATDAEVYPADGELLLTTISLQQVHPFQAFAGWLRSDVDVLPEAQIRPPETSDQEYRQFNFQVMDESKQNAIVVALRRLGHQVKETGAGALVEKVLPQFPAQGRLQPGDVITSIDGQPVALVGDAIGIISSHRPGDVLRIKVTQPDGTEPREVEVPVASDPEQAGKTVLGVFLRPFKRDFDVPFQVDIKSGNIGGPSAGLAFTLGVLDALTEGELTGGRKVAVTGTIELDGRVGDVGGVAQKTSAVKAAGAEVFIVPAGEYEVARARAGRDLTVVRVTTLQEALDALGRLGGDLTALGPAASGQRS